MPDNNAAGLTRTASIAEDITIETVELILNADTTYVGDLEIVLTSPAGTESVLAVQRNDPQNNYTDFVFMSMRCFGESSQGDWTVRLADMDTGELATWEDFEVKVYGTASPACSVADMDADGDTDIDDINTFVAWFVDQIDGNADIDGDGDEDIDDINAFVAAFVSGCA